MPKFFVLMASTALAVLLALALVVAGVASAQEEKAVRMADALRSSADKGGFAATLKRSTGKDYVPAELVVGLKEGVTNSTRGLEKAAVAADGQVKDELEDPKNRAVLMQFPTEQAARAARDELEKRPDVEYVERNGIVEGQSVSSDPQVGYQWFHTVIRKTANLGTLSSTPPTIAVVDTGVDYNNPDLDGNVWTNPAEVAGNGVDNDNDGYIDNVHGHDFVNNDGDPMDDHYHGTAVAGLAAAETSNGIGGEGVSPNSRILAIKVLDATNRGTCFTVAQGMAYARTANTTPLAKVINMSIAGPDCTVQSAEVNAIKPDGKFLVAGAANSTTTDPTNAYPGADPDTALRVMATNEADCRAYYSNFSPSSNSSLYT